MGNIGNLLFILGRFSILTLCLVIIGMGNIGNLLFILGRFSILTLCLVIIGMGNTGNLGEDILVFLFLIILEGRGLLIFVVFLIFGGNCVLIG